MRSEARAHRPARLPGRRRRPERVDLGVERVDSASQSRSRNACHARHDRRTVDARSTSRATRPSTRADRRRVDDARAIGGRFEAVGVRERASRKQAVAEMQQRQQAHGHRSRLMRDEPRSSTTGVNGWIRSRERDARGTRAPAPCPARPADDRLVGHHHRLVAVADVVGEQRPLRRRPRLDDEHRFGPLDHGHDDRAARRGRSSRRSRSTVPRGERRAELDAAVRPAAAARPEAAPPSRA